MWHKHLLRQIKRHLGVNEKLPENLLPLFDAISDYYTDNDIDRKQHERTLDISSTEMFKLNTQLQQDIAQRKYTEAEIQKSKQRYQSFIAQSTEGIWCFENATPIALSLPIEEQIERMFDGVLTECNNVMAKMYGYTFSKELLGIPLQQLMPKTEESIAYLTHFINEGYNATNVESKEVDRFGNTKYFSNSLNGIIENGMLVRAWGLQRDITEWKNAQEKIIKSETRLKASQRVAQIGSWEIDILNTDDIGANPIFWSEETYKIYGLEPSQNPLSLEFFYSLVYPDDVQRLKSELRHFINTGESYNIEHRVVFPDGSIKTIHGLAVLEYDPVTKKPIKVIGTAQDITERKNIQAKMLLNEGHLKASQRIAKIGSWEQGLANLEHTNSNPLRWSDETYRIFGFEPGQVEVTNELFDSFVHPDDLPKLNAALRNSVAQGKTYNVEFRLLLKDGTTKTVMEMGEVQIDPITKKPIRLIGAIQDITESKLIQDKVQTNETHLRNTQRIAKIGSWEYTLENLDDLISNSLTWSEETFRIYGYEPNEIEITSDFFMSTVYPPDAPQVAEAFMTALQKGETYSAEHRIVLKDKSIKTVHAIGEFVYDSTTLKPIKMVGTVQDVTDWKTVQEKIQVNQSHLNTSQRIAKVGSWMIDFPNGITDIKSYEIDWSDETYRIFGLKSHQPNITSELFFSIIHPSDLREIKHSILIAAKHGHLFKEHRIITPDGIEKTVLERAEYVYDPQTKRPLRMMGTTQDITEQKNKEQTLKKAEANMRALLENTNVAYILLDENINVLTFNQKANQLAIDAGMRQLIAGRNYLEWVDEKRKNTVLANIKKVLTEKTTLQYEIKYEKYLGSADKWLDVRMHPIHSDNELLGLSISILDISENKKTEQLLKESNERYIMATKATNDVIWDWDIINKQFYRSENFGQLFGYPVSQDNIYIENWVSNIHPDDRDRVSKKVEETINSKGINQWQDEYKFYTASGDIAYVQDKAYITHDEKGRPTRMVGAMRNITAKKLAELEHKKITNDLIQRNKDLEQFAYIVSHNLRAPVANIIGFLQVFNNYELSETEKKEYIDGLSTSANKLDEVIMDLNEILNVKREISELKETIKFSTLATDTIYTLKNLITKENITINTNFDAVNEIITLKSYMSSIFYNLISNAIKYRRLEVDTIIEIKSAIENNKIILTFNDNGMGIDLEKKGHQVFGLYKRFHRNVEGKGMGLFMVKTQVETLGGKISVQSQPNQGTQFRIEFEG
jgi:PAS domain S-box-containing protein